MDGWMVLISWVSGFVDIPKTHDLLGLQGDHSPDNVKFPDNSQWDSRFTVHLRQTDLKSGRCDYTAPSEWSLYTSEPLLLNKLLTCDTFH